MSAPSARTRLESLAAAAPVLAAIPFLVAAVTLALRPHHGFHVAGDQAVLAIAVRRAGHLRQLVGPYSRFGWHHPGPALFYALAPTAAAVGAAASLYIGTALLQAVVAAGAVAGAARAGGRLVGCVAAAALPAWLVLAASGRWLQDGWNPLVVVLPMGALLVVAAAAAAGTRWALVGAVALASFVVQTHVSTAPPALAVLLLATVAVVVGALRGEGRRAGARALRGPVGAATAAGLLLWAPPLVDALRHRPSNLTLLWRFFVDGPKGHHSAREAATVVGAMLRPWAAGRAVAADHVVAGHALRWLVLFVAVTLLAIAAGLWTRSRFATALGVAGLLAVALAAWSATTVIGPVYPYLLAWVSMVPAVIVVSLAASVAAVVRLRWKAGVDGPAAVDTPAAVTAGVALAVAAAIAVSSVVVRLPSLAARSDGAVAAVLAAAGPSLDGHRGTVVVGVRSFDAWPVAAGVVDGLEGRGRRVTVGRRWLSLMGDHLRRRRAEAVEVDLWLPRDLPAALGPDVEVVRAGGYAVTIGPAGAGADAQPVLASGP